MTTQVMHETPRKVTQQFQGMEGPGQGPVKCPSPPAWQLFFLHLSPRLQAQFILLLLSRRILFPVHPNASEAAPLLPAGVPENAGAHEH